MARQTLSTAHRTTSQNNTGGSILEKKENNA